MAKKKTKSTKTKPVDDDELQVKRRKDDEATEVEADDAEPVEELEEDTELNVDDAEPVEEAEEDTELNTDDAEPVEEAEEDTELNGDDADAEEPAEEDAEFNMDDEEPAEDEVAEDAGDDDEDDDDEESVDEGPPLIPAKLTKTAGMLIFLNWIFAQVFLIFAYLDHAERVKYSYRTMVHHAQIDGLPLKSEENVADENYSPLSIETRPYLSLTSEQLEEAFKKRPGTTKSAVSGSTKFAPYEESIVIDGGKLISYTRISYRLRPSDLEHPDLLRDIFQDVPEPVKTLEEAITKLQEKLPGDIKKAAEEVREGLAKMNESDKKTYVKSAQTPYSWDSVLAKKMEADIDNASGGLLDAMQKRAFVRRTLFPMAWNVHQVKALDEKLVAAKDAELDSWVEDAVQRRTYYDILAPINIFRPGDLKDFKIEKLADRTEYPVEKLKEIVDQRLKSIIADRFDLDVHFGPVWEKEKTKEDAMKRHSIEKRRTIAFTFFALSQVTVPGTDKKLYPKGVERAQVISGLREFTNASIYYVRTMRVLEERVTAAVLADRQGVIAGLKGNTGGQTAEYEEEIDRLVKIVDQIDVLEKRLKDLKDQYGERVKTYDQRAAQHKEIFDKLLNARKNTAKYVEELREKQDQLHTALIELSEAGDRNFRLYEEIRALELSIMKAAPKGGKK